MGGARGRGRRRPRGGRHRGPGAGGPAEELADAGKGPVLAAHLDRWGWEVGRCFEDLDKDSDADALGAAAPDFPVFRVADPS